MPDDGRTDGRVDSVDARVSLRDAQVQAITNGTRSAEDSRMCSVCQCWSCGEQRISIRLIRTHAWPRRTHLQGTHECGSVPLRPAVALLQCPPAGLVSRQVAPERQAPQVGHLQQGLGNVPRAGLRLQRQQRPPAQRPAAAPDPAGSGRPVCQDVVLPPCAGLSQQMHLWQRRWQRGVKHGCANGNMWHAAPARPRLAPPGAPCQWSAAGWRRRCGWG